MSENQNFLITVSEEPLQNFSDKDIETIIEARLQIPNALACRVEDGAAGKLLVTWFAGSDLIDAARRAGKSPREFLGPATIGAIIAQRSLGSLSAKYESKGDPAAIGHDSTGGWSYGTYQLASAKGSVASFLRFLDDEDRGMARRLHDAGGDAAARNGTQAFKDAWRSLATGPASAERFRDLQHAFIKATYYDPFAAKLRQDHGLDLAARSNALRQVAWSTAVQHGPDNRIFQLALPGKTAATMSDRDIIMAVYAERMKVEEHFPSSTPAVQEALKTRFQNELRDALALLP